MANAWGLAWGNPSAWGVSWGTGAVVADVASYQDPGGFWTEQHRKIKELEERVPAEVGAPVTALSDIAEFIPPEVNPDDADLEEILELLSIVDVAERASV